MTTELATKQTTEIALPILEADASPSEIMEALAENLGGEGLNVWDLDRVKIPAGGGTTWSVPTLESPDGEDRKELLGVPVFWKYSRVYYEHEMGDGESGPPQCKSNDGKWGVGDPGGACATCPLSQWGANDERPACKQQVEVFLLTEDAIMPTAIVLPPSSIKPWREYLKKTSLRGIPYYGAQLSLTLMKDKSPGGIAYSKINPSFKARLPKETALRLKEFKAALEPMLLRAPTDGNVPDATTVDAESVPAPQATAPGTITRGQVTSLQMRFNELRLSNDDRDLKLTVVGNLLGREVTSSTEVREDEYPALNAQLEALVKDVTAAGVNARGFLKAQTEASGKLGDGAAREQALKGYAKVHGRMDDMFPPEADVPQF